MQVWVDGKLVVDSPSNVITSANFAAVASRSYKLKVAS